MPASKKDAFASGAAIGAAAMLLVGAGGYGVAASAWAEPAVNAPAPSAGAPRSFADLVAKVAPAVVSIDVVGRPVPNPVVLGPGQIPFGFATPGQGGHSDGSPFGFNFKWVLPGAPDGQPLKPPRASGSGFFISPEGYIVTNNHVIDNAAKITVHTDDGRAFQARVIGRDPATDLAVLKVDGGPFQYVSFEDRAQPRVGDWVVAVGNPFGLGGTATAGIVSALGRQDVSESSFVDYMQIDAPINHGNSGGPTFDVEGHVVGVNTAIISPSGGSVGIGFDIPADVAASVTRQLIDDGKVTRGYIGATIQSLTPDLAASLGLPTAHGAVVDELRPGGPAEQAGLKSGDVILSVDGQGIDSASDLTRHVSLVKPGGDIALGLVRDGVRRQIEVKSGLRPSEAFLARVDTAAPGEQGQDSGPGVLGMQLSPDPHGGLVVDGVDPKSDAAAKGLRQGDVILRAGVRVVGSSADLSQAAASARAAGRKSLPLLVARGGAQIYLPIRVAAGAG